MPSIIEVEIADARPPPVSSRETQLGSAGEAKNRPKPAIRPKVGEDRQGSERDINERAAFADAPN